MKKWLIIAGALLVTVMLILIFTGVFQSGGKIVLSTENYEVSKRLLDSYIDLKKNEYVDKYKKEYGDYFLQTAGLDPDESLKKQESCYGGTWYDYFKDLATEDLKNKMVCCESARESGLKSDEKLLAAANKKYKILLPGIKKSDLETATELEVLSQMYLDEFTESNMPSESEKKEYYENNKTLFDCIDFYRIVINDQDNTESNSELAEKIVDSIKKVGFNETLKIYNINDSNDGFEIELKSDYMYDDITQFGCWAFDPARQDGDVISFSGRGIVSVYYLEKSSHTLDYIMKKIEKITLYADSEKTPDDLYEISDKLKGDNNTSENLQLYANKKGFVVEKTDALKEDLSYNLEDWLYGTEHKIGDNTVLEDGFLTSFVRYCGDGDSYLQTRVKKDILSARTNEHLKQLKEEIEIKEHQPN